MTSSAPRTILITGAGGGLGKATATSFLASGANVAICDVNAERLQTTEQEWITTAGFKAERILATVADISDEASVQSLIDAILAKFGRLDVLINNAGIMDNMSPVADCDPEIWHRVMAVNVTGPYFTCRAVIPAFLKNGADGGVIINVCSVASQTGAASGAAYTTSKHALLGLSRNTAFAYGNKGIYSIAMTMGGMDTNINDAMAKGVHEEYLKLFLSAHTTVDPEKHLVKLETVTKYLQFVTDRDIAKGLNGSAVDLRNNWPEH